VVVCGADGEARRRAGSTNLDAARPLTREVDRPHALMHNIRAWVHSIVGGAHAHRPVSVVDVRLRGSVRLPFGTHEDVVLDAGPHVRLRRGGCAAQTRTHRGTMDTQMMIQIWHNPRCSKSRAALERLHAEFGADAVEVRRYLEAPPERDALARVAAMLDGGAAALLRAKEPAAVELGLEATTTPERILDALVAHPSLIERPVVIASGRACIPRPLEVLDPWIEGLRGANHQSGA
jgi:arsenate reductase